MVPIGHLLCGTLNAIFFLPLLITKRNRQNINSISKNKILPSLKDFFSIITTFSFVTISWIFFRSLSIKNAFEYIGGILKTDQIAFPPNIPFTIYTLLVFFIIVEWIQRNKEHALELNKEKN